MSFFNTAQKKKKKQEQNLGVEVRFQSPDLSPTLKVNYFGYFYDSLHDKNKRINSVWVITASFHPNFLI